MDKSVGKPSSDYPTETNYEFAGGSLAYFAPAAPGYAEVRELRGNHLIRALSISESGACVGSLWIQPGKARREFGD